jgi:TRAP-type C4-dicarboxylate transport system substrate-binding protein
MLLRLAPLLLVSQLAHAEPTVLRMAAIAPDGTLWARELKAFMRAVEAGTGGAVKIKAYFGGIAGDEPTALERARKGQLSGAVGALMCEQLAPVLRVLRVPGLIRNREEARHVVNVLHPEITAEMSKNGFAYIGSAGFGLDVLFTRKPVTSMAELRATRFWLREHDEVMRSVLAQIGVQLTMVPHIDGARLYDEGRVDGFITPPANALSFQFAGQAHAFTDFKLGYLIACGALTNASFDALPIAYREEILRQAAVLATRFEELNVEFDAQLLGKLFAKQGLRRVEPNPAFRRDLDAALSSGRQAIDPALVPPALLKRVSDLVDAFRRAEKQKPR